MSKAKSKKKTKRKTKQKKFNYRWIWILVGALIVLGIMAGVLVWLIPKVAQTGTVRVGLPQLELQLAKGVTFDDFKEGDKTTKYYDNTLTLTDDSKIKFTDVTLKGRGNTTWGLPKKPMQIKFSHKTPFLGMEKAKKWVLLANYLDASQIRNDTAMYVSRMLDFSPTLGGEFAELTVNGDYQGLYYVTHHVGVSKNEVDLRDEKGVLVEVDNLHKHELKCYASTEGMCLSVKDEVNKDMEAEAMKEFLRDFNTLEAAAKKQDFKTVSSVIDVDSFAKYFLLSEFTVNPDAYTSSWFMYKDGSEDKIHAGPGWDFDLALGNHKWRWNISEDFYSPELDMIREVEAAGGKIVTNGKVIEKEPDQAISKLVYRLVQIPEFRERVKSIFNEQMHGKKDKLLNHMIAQVNDIYGSAMRNQERWNLGDFKKEVKYLMDWTAKRYEHFEEVYGE